MGKRIIAVNAGPRKGWNTDTLIMAGMHFYDFETRTPPACQW